MDAGHEEIEELLAAMEFDVRSVYEVAARDLEKKVVDYWDHFEWKNKIKLAQLAAEEITQEEYNQWRIGQMLIGQRWEEMLAVVTQDLYNARKIAESVILGYMPDAFAVSQNYGSYQIDMLLQAATSGGMDIASLSSSLGTSWTMYDRNTVIRLLRDNPQILPELNPASPMARKIAEGKVKKWEEKQFRSEILQGIIQGESNVDIAKRIKDMTDADWKSVMRYARTATTGVECAGRIESYKQAEEMGIELEQQWLATLDGRTRHSHRQLDGQHKPVGEKFSNGCEFPGDPKGPADQIWNCRCTLIPMLTGIPELEADNDVTNLDNRNIDHLPEGMTYDEWKKGHGISQPIMKAKEIGDARRREAIIEYRKTASRLGVEDDE